MLALTIKQPWVWAILSSDKRVENRSWAPRSLGHLPATVAIHAGASYDKYGADLIRELLWWCEVPDEAELRRSGQMGAVVGCADVVSTTTESSSPWFSGPIGWELDNVRRCTPLPMRGQLGLWRLPDGASLEGLSRCHTPQEVCANDGHLERVRGVWPEDHVCPRCGNTVMEFGFGVGVVSGAEERKAEQA